MDDAIEKLAQGARQASALAELTKAGVTTDVIKRLLTIKAVEIGRRRSTRVMADLFFGARMRVDLREVVSRHLYLSGSFEQALSLFFYRYLVPGMTFLDVGAHYGYYSLLAAARVGPQGRVVALEPTPQTFTMLSRNLSGYPGAQLHKAGAWKSSGTLQLNDFGVGWAAFNSIAGMRLGPALSIEPERRLDVPVWSLDEFCEDRNLLPDVVKIDVESAELEVLQGMDGILRSVRPIVSIEVGDFEHLIQNGLQPSHVFLNYIQYRNYVLLEPRMEGLSRHIVDVARNYKYDNIICVPAEKVGSLNAMRADGPMPAL